MGIVLSCPFAELEDLEKGLESFRLKPVGFNGPTLDPKFAGSGRMIMEASFSFKGKKFETEIRINPPAYDKGDDISGMPDRTKESVETISKSPCMSLTDPKYEAAVKLQKVYKSFRTRRKLADCAVLVEQSWWKLIDFAELKRSSISFFDIEKQETAISKWSRARTRAAKVGKGLSKNDKAQKLALQHWLEAIDPRHRYGHNLHFYYLRWLHSQSRQPFFYWLDIGEGKDINLVEKCSRSKLQQQCIKYLGPMERKAYEVFLQEGKFVYKASAQPVHTVGEDKDAKWIFVLSASKVLYIGKKKKGSFQHSSFLAGGAAIAAGRLVIENGVLKAVWPHSGHYQPTEENFKDFILFLLENNVDITDVKMSPVDEEEYWFNKQKSRDDLRASLSEEDLLQDLSHVEIERIKPACPSQGGNDTRKDECSTSENSGTLAFLGEQEKAKSGENRNAELLTNDGYESEAPEEEPLEDSEAVPIPDKSVVDHKGKVFEEVIVERIKAKKESKSLQLGRQLSCRWTTGAGPRIGCVRDYPSHLRFRALERVELSPRNSTLRRLRPLPPATAKSVVKD